LTLFHAGLFSVFLGLWHGFADSSSPLLNRHAQDSLFPSLPMFFPSLTITQKYQGTVIPLGTSCCIWKESEFNFPPTLAITIIWSWPGSFFLYPPLDSKPSPASFLVSPFESSSSAPGKEGDLIFCLSSFQLSNCFLIHRCELASILNMLLPTYFISSFFFVDDF